MADGRMRWKGIRRFAKDVGLKLNPALIRDLPGTVDSGSVFDGGLRLTSELIHPEENSRRFSPLMT